MFIEHKDEKTQPKPHTKLYPILVPSKTMLNGDIPVTPIGRDGRRDDVGVDPAWNKKSGKLYWVSEACDCLSPPNPSAVLQPVSTITRASERTGGIRIANGYIS